MQHIPVPFGIQQVGSMKGFGFGQETSSPVRLHACILWAGLDLSGSTALARIAFLLLSDPQPAGASRQPIHHRFPAMNTPTCPAMDPGFADARRMYTEQVYWQLEKQAGKDALLKQTSGKPRGEVVFIISEFLQDLTPEGTAASAIRCEAERFLLDMEALLEALEAAPEGSDD
jgi:hypothetical protein